MTRKITLIGAGLTGSLLSIFLAKRGFKVEIFERRPDLRAVEISAGRSINLALANRGINALQEIGLMDEIRKVILPMAGRMLHDEQGKLQFLSYGQRPEEVIYSVSRGGLNGMLMDLAEREGVAIHFQQNCRDVDFEQKTVRLRDEVLGQEREHHFETLIGTDGSASAVRAAIMRETGGECREIALEHSYKELTIEPGEDGAFRMDKASLHIWPRGQFMLIALPNIDGSFTVTLFLPTEGPVSFASLDNEAALRAFFEKYFADAIPLLPDYVQQFFQNPTGQLATVRCQPWLHRDALLLGDAAHAIVPFHGQGMNCGFEDCSAFDQCLSLLDQGWEQVFKAFEAERKPNAEAIADMALENYIEMRASVRDPKFQLKKELSFRLEELHPERFIPRYSMVMFHSIPYAVAQARGKLQEGLLDELTAGCTELEQVDLEQAARLIEERL